MRPRAALLAAALLAGCAAPAAHVPPFARKPYEPFSRAAVVAIAMDEWRAFGAPIDDDPLGPHPPRAADQKPERAEGLWQRVGLYWWLGLDAGERETRWTGKHDAAGHVFPAADDGRFAWSAAFVSYVMRLAGAGPRFPYAEAHHTYINAAIGMSLGRTKGWDITAERPDAYAPRPGDVICYSRTPRPLRFDDLPAGRFPAHCDIVVRTAPGWLAAIGGNVDDAVTLTHVKLTADGRLVAPGQPPLDRRPWLAVLRLLHAAAAPPGQ